MFELNAGVSGGELPIDANLFCVSVVSPAENAEIIPG
jgi:hypothetical protein